MKGKILNYIEQHREQILSDVMLLIKTEAPSSDIEGLTEVRKVLKQLIVDRTGVLAEEIEVDSGRNVLYLPSDQKSIVLMGHYDTVHPVGKLPVVLEENTLKGPGVLDMKTGLVMGIWLYKMMKDFKLDCPVSLLFNGDEEIGSRDSKHILVQKASNARCALILEPAVENGDLKTGRKGAMSCVIQMHGKASHAGNNPLAGINAIEEMAHHVIALQKLNDHEAGTTVNVGKISGGTVSNVVPDLCEITVDLRYKTLSEKQRITKAIEDIELVNQKVIRKISFSDGSDPMEQTYQNIALYEQMKECASSFGVELNHQFVGGASDGNRISHLGLPILDGMGAVGKGIHALDEQIDLKRTLEKLAVNALFLSSMK